MTVNGRASWIHLGAVALVVSALFLAVFPLLRPFGDRSSNSIEVAQTLTSTRWVVSHILGTLGFVLLPIGLFGLYGFLRGSPVERRALHGLILSWLGIGLFLPIFGNETFALPAIGNAALTQKNPDLTRLEETIHTQPHFLAFLIPSLLLLAVGGIFIAVAVWKSGMLPKWSGILLAIGLAFFFPLFPQSIRVLDGLLMGVGGVWLALGILLNKTPSQKEILSRKISV